MATARWEVLVGRSKRRVKIVDGSSTQTINICTPEDKDGQYDQIFRITGPGAFVTEADLAGHTRTRAMFIEFLASRDAEEEIVCPHAKQMKPDPEWTARVIPHIEAAIEQVARDFLAVPYLHRVEHSIHCSLYQALTAIPMLGGMQKLGSVETGYVHKEWPATTKEGVQDRRGNFDLAILGPAGPTTNRRKTLTEKEFRGGLVLPAAVIEVGLNYGLEHLQGDVDKLRKCGVAHGYILHLLHPGMPDGGVEAALRDPAGLAAGGTKIMYVRHDSATSSPPSWLP